MIDLRGCKLPGVMGEAASIQHRFKGRCHFNLFFVFSLHFLVILFLGDWGYDLNEHIFSIES